MQTFVEGIEWHHKKRKHEITIQGRQFMKNCDEKCPAVLVMRNNPHGPMQWKF